MEHVEGYFDTAATALPDPKLYRIFEETAFRYPGNPSSIHKIGLQALKRLDQARAVAATALGGHSEQIVFTSGGTESNNIVISSFLTRTPGAVLCPQTEHASVYEPVGLLQKNGWTLQSPPLDGWGRLSCDHLEATLSPQTKLVCLMAVNNETGLIQDIESLTKVIRAYEEKIGRKIHIHCDGVQALGKLELDPVSWGIDTLSLSSHKIGSPYGTGLLYLNRLIEPLFRGGGQEEGLRPGTHNLPGICAFAEGLRKTRSPGSEEFQKVKRLSTMITEGIRGKSRIVLLPDGRSEDSDSPFVPAIINLSIPSLPSEAALRLLSDKGFYVSSGSACSSRKAKKTRILLALGVPEALVSGALRISFDARTGEAEVTGLLTALHEIIPPR